MNLMSTLAEEDSELNSNKLSRMKKVTKSRKLEIKILWKPFIAKRVNQQMNVRRHSNINESQSLASNDREGT